MSASMARPDGATWTANRLPPFPNSSIPVNIRCCSISPRHPEVKFVRAHWEVARWGRGTETPMFEFGVTLKEVPPEILREATAEAKTLA